MKNIIYPLLFSLALFLGACSGGSNKDNNNDSQSSQAAETQTNTSSNGVRTIDIIGLDQMKFVVKDNNQSGITTAETVGSDGLVRLETISAEPGEEIHIRLTTKSQLPASAMAHNFILLMKSVDAQTFDDAAAKAKSNDFIPTDKTDQIIAHTDLASGGETVEVTFTVPETSGDYPYLCSFPGHFAAGMKGTLEVQ